MQNTPATSSTAPRIRQAVRTANAKTAPPALPRAPLLHGLNRAVLWQLAACGTGLLLSAGQVYGGAAPFGLGLLLGCGNTYAPAAALGCLAGLLLFQPLDTALKLAGACIGALTARIVGRQLGQTGFLPGAACGVGVLLLEQGLVTLVGGASPRIRPACCAPPRWPCWWGWASTSSTSAPRAGPACGPPWPPPVCSALPCRGLHRGWRGRRSAFCAVPARTAWSTPPYWLLCLPWP